VDENVDQLMGKLIMRYTILWVAFALLGASAAYSEIAPEQASVETLGPPSDDWFVSHSGRGAYLFDSASGDMLGLLSLTAYTPGIAVNRSRGEVYAAETYLSRLYRGEREEVLTVYDITTLSPVAEIDIPDKTAEVRGDTNIGLMGNGKHVAVYNLTPAQSISIIDVENRKFVAEISTPGCAMIMPVNDASFLMVCGDGSVQLIRLAADGTETKRVRSKKFFSVGDDPVFDRSTRTANGWLLLSHAGMAVEVSAAGSKVTVGKSWSMVSAAERKELWRPGGFGPLSVHRSSGLAFVLMHQGQIDTHHEPGSELWIFDTAKRKRVMRWRLDQPWSNILVLQGERPRLVAVTAEGEVQVYDALQRRFERSIAEPGPYAGMLQEF
jgi:methylamine dehydrogenase heavy chain